MLYLGYKDDGFVIHATFKAHQVELFEYNKTAKKILQGDIIG